MKLLLDLPTQFSKDTDMKLGKSKCVYLQIKRGKKNNKKDLKKY